MRRTESLYQASLGKAVFGAFFSDVSILRIFLRHLFGQQLSQRGMLIGCLWMLSSWCVAEAMQRTLFTDLARVNHRIWAVGDCGRIVFSDDEARRWQSARTPVCSLLTAVYFVDHHHGWAVGHGGVILHSHDGGVTWRQQAYQSTYPLLDVWFATPMKGFAVGAYGQLIHTENGGKSWRDISQRLSDAQDWHLNAIVGDAATGRVMVAGESGLIYVSYDAGRQWKRVTTDADASWMVMDRVGQRVVAAGLGEKFQVSQDAGSRWVLYPRPFSGGIQNIFFLPLNQLATVNHAGEFWLGEIAADTVYWRHWLLPGQARVSALLPLTIDTWLLAGEGGLNRWQLPLKRSSRLVPLKSTKQRLMQPIIDPVIQPSMKGVR